MYWFLYNTCCHGLTVYIYIYIRYKCPTILTLQHRKKSMPTININFLSNDIFITLTIGHLKEFWYTFIDLTSRWHSWYFITIKMGELHHKTLNIYMLFYFICTCYACKATTIKEYGFQQKKNNQTFIIFFRKFSN